MKPLFIRLLIVCSWVLVQLPAFSQTSSSPQVTSSEMYGNPYLFRDWSAGTVKFTSGRIVNQFKLRFDCVRNQLLLQFQGSTFAAESKVQEFVIYTNKKKDSMLFRKGYPAIGNGTDNTYYHVLLDDKVHLLRLVSKNIIEEKELIASGRLRGRLEDVEKFYLLKNGVMVLLPQDKEQLLIALPEQANVLSQFIADNDLRFKTPADYIQLAKKINELQ